MIGESIKNIFKYTDMKVEEQVVISSLFADNMTREHFDFYINQTWMSYSNISSLQHIVLDDDVFIRYTIICFPSTNSIPLCSNSYNANINLLTSNFATS